MQHFPLHQLSDSDAVRLYEWAERSSSAVLKCTCQQVRRIKTLPELSYAIGGQTLFLHYETPALVAEVCGMVVGVSPKEDQVSYEVDDGTAVLRIVETRKSLRQTETRSGQAAEIAATPCGVPECYIMPPQPKASTSASRLDDSTSTVIRPPLVPRFQVADIISCTGKMQIDRGGQRFLVSQRMSRCDDINMECYHQLDAIKTEIEIHRKPFDWSRVESVEKVSKFKQAMPHRTVRQTTARLLVSDLSPNGNAVSAPTMQVNTGSKKCPERPRLPEEAARRLLSGNTLVSSPPSTASSAFPLPRANEPSRSSRSSESSARELRAPAKIADRKLTESYFQLQVQQHISRHHRSQPFALSDLQSDPTLSTLAQRLVRIRLQHRLASHSVASSRSVSLDTTEQQLDKVCRLFEWAIRKMMHDGFITLADIDNSQQSISSRKGDRGSSEKYRLVTPEFLLRPLQTLLGNKVITSPHDAVSQDVDDLTTRLRILDDRFRNVDRCLVQDSLILYRARCTPIVID